MANTQNVLQRQLADLITRCAHLNEIRLLIGNYFISYYLITLFLIIILNCAFLPFISIAQGAKVNIPVTQGIIFLFPFHLNLLKAIELFASFANR